jgi:hypothetical protein
MIEKKNYPITVLEDISNLLKYFYAIENKYSDNLKMLFNETHLIEISAKNNSGYRFIVSTPNQGVEKKPYFNVTKFPKNVTTNEVSVFSVLASVVSKHFDTWISILKRYESINITKEDFVSKEEEKQFYNEFELTDDEDDIKTLPIESQFKVYRLLEELQTKLESKSDLNPEVKDIIQDAEELKNDIRHLPQRNVAKRVAKIQVKIKKIGIKFFLDVVDVAYKESIKFALRGGIEGIHQILN